MIGCLVGSDERGTLVQRVGFSILTWAALARSFSDCSMLRSFSSTYLRELSMCQIFAFCFLLFAFANSARSFSNCRVLHSFSSTSLRELNMCPCVDISLRILLLRPWHVALLQQHIPACIEHVSAFSCEYCDSPTDCFLSLVTKKQPNERLMSMNS